MSKELYQKESNVFLKEILNTLLLRQMKQQPMDHEMMSSSLSFSRIELFITSDCNLKCEYCYLHNFGDKLYPKEYRKQGIILKNLKLILEWIVKEGLHPSMLEIFSGEIWYSSFGVSVLDSILEIYQRSGVISYTISIPTNMCFLAFPKYAEKMQWFVDEFKKLDVSLIFSASLDGAILEDMTRPLKSSKSKIVRDEEFYDTVFEFCARNGYGFHPMISAYGIHKWKENYLWFKKKMDEYDMDVSERLMMLEVRNDDWTDNKIDEYLEFLEFLWQQTFDGVPEENMCDCIINKWYTCDNDIAKRMFYHPLKLNVYSRKFDCGYQERLTVRVGDLAIVPCHRTSYDYFVIGNFITNDDNSKIVDIKATNPEVALGIYSINPTISNIRCGGCLYNKLCFKQCLGAQFENNNDLFIPCKTVCKMLSKKIDFLIDKFDKYGVSDRLSMTYNPEAIELYATINEFKTIKERNKECCCHYDS